MIETEKTLAETPALGIAERAADVAKDAAEKAAEAGKEAVETGWADAGKAAHDVATSRHQGSRRPRRRKRSKPAPVTGWADSKKIANAGNDADKTTVHASKAVANQSNTAAPAASAAEKAAAAKSALKSLPVSGPLDAAACQAALNATLVLDKIEFRAGGMKIGLRFRLCVGPAGGVATALPGAESGDWRPRRQCRRRGGQSGAVATSRRQSVRYLVNEGVAAARLTGVGYGDKQPIASNDHEEGRGENRRIEFILK